MNVSKRATHLALIVTGLLLGVSAIAYATVPSSGGVISGCYEKRTGLLRVIDTEAGKKCTTFETPISWNQKGEQGLQGIQGERGPAGERGPQGESGKLGLAGQSCPEGQFATGFDSAGDLTCGRGTDPGLLHVSPVGVNFGSVDVPELSMQRIWLTNVGDSPVQTVGVSLSPRFWISSMTCPYMLAAGTSCTMDVTFEPTASVTYVETLIVGGIEIMVVGTGVVS
jgi:hypothetical protein